MPLFKTKKVKTYTEDQVKVKVQEALNAAPFDFEQLWVEPDEGGGLMKLLPAISIVIDIIVLVIVIIKK